jgi:hypothetical protein
MTTAHKATQIWKPTAAECKLIKECAARESYPPLRPTQITVTPMNRVNTKDPSQPIDFNAARVTKTPWGTEERSSDTDLWDKASWTEFRKGVTLTEEGHAIIEAVIYHVSGERFFEDEGLYGNLTVYYSGGKITKIRGLSDVYYLAEEAAPSKDEPR